MLWEEGGERNRATQAEEKNTAPCARAPPPNPNPPQPTNTRRKLMMPSLPSIHIPFTLNKTTWSTTNATSGTTWGAAVDGGGSAGFSKNLAINFTDPAGGVKGVSIHVDGGGGGGAGVVVDKGAAKGANPYVPTNSGASSAASSSPPGSQFVPANGK